MISRMIDLTIVVLYFLMFKVCGIIGISKIEFFNFSGAERIKQNKKKNNKKKHSKTSNLLRQSLCKESGESKHYIYNNVFKRVFDNFFNDIQVDRLCICFSLVIDV